MEDECAASIEINKLYFLWTSFQQSRYTSHYPSLKLLWITLDFIFHGNTYELVWKGNIANEQDVWSLFELVQVTVKKPFKKQEKKSLNLHIISFMVPALDLHNTCYGGKKNSLYHFFTFHNSSSWKTDQLWNINFTSGTLCVFGMHQWRNATPR